MRRNRNYKISILALIAAGLLALVLLGCSVVQPNPQARGNEIEVAALPTAPSYSISEDPLRCKQSNVNCVEAWNGADIVLYSGPKTGQTFSVNGATGDITTAGSVTLQAWQRAAIQTTLEVTNTATFTPTGMFQPLAATVAVTPTLSRSGFYTGTLLILHNASAYTITVPVSPTNAVVVPFRAVSLIFDGTWWVRR